MEAAMRRISPGEARELIEKEGYVYVDVRSVPEFESGHPEGAYNVPLLHMGPAGMTPNPEFLSVMQQRFPKDAFTLGRDRRDALPFGPPLERPKAVPTLEGSHRSIEGRAVESQTTGEPAERQRAMEPRRDQDRELGRRQTEAGEGARVDLRHRASRPP